LALLDAVLKEKPTAARLACRIARAFIALGDHARAGKVLADLGAGGDAPLVRHTAGLVALAAGDAAKAQQEFQAAAAVDQSYADPRFELAKLAARIGRYDDATARYDAALRTSPEDPYRRLRLAVAQAEAGYLDDAERTLESARKDLESAGSRGLLAGALVAMARATAERDAKQARRAEALYRQAISLPGAPAFALYHAARYHEGRRDLKTALAEYRSAIDRDPQLTEALLRLGLLLAADAKSRDEAAAHLRAYLKLLPDGEHTERARSELKRLGRAAP
jgi:tetratricopeptide (TPR) repeat protein